MGMDLYIFDSALLRLQVGIWTLGHVVTTQAGAALADAKAAIREVR